MRILVAGATGQVARCLVERGQASTHEVIAVGRPDLDVSDSISVERVMQDVRPDIVVNAAAHTAVEQAEDERVEAMSVNSLGASNLARAAASRHLPILHLSTDYVFDGTSPRPYLEDDEISPINAYGWTKLMGEEVVRDMNPKHLILRTSWVFSPFGGNFLKTMLKLAREHGEVRVVADQVGQPTYGLHIADALLAICDHLSDPSFDAPWGTYHMAASGEASWAEFAEDVFAQSAELGGQSARVCPVATKDYPTKAKRPLNSRLDTGKLLRAWGVSLPDWREGVRDCVRRVHEADVALKVELG